MWVRVRGQTDGRVKVLIVFRCKVRIWLWQELGLGFSVSFWVRFRVWV